MRVQTPLFDSLEPRQLLAGIRTIQDVDGDVIRVSVIGAGDIASLTTSAGVDLGFIQSLTLANTNAQSKLDFKLVTKNGDGRIDLRGLTVPGTLRSINASAVNAISAADITIGDVGQISWGNILDNITQFQIGTSPTALNLGTRTATFGNVGSGATLVFNTFLKSATFSSVNGDGLSFLGGVNKLKSMGDLRTELSNGSANADIDVVEVVGDLQVSGDITGDVKSIKADNVLDTGNDPFQIGGSLDAFVAKGNFAGSFNADYYGTFSANHFSGTLDYRNGDGSAKWGFTSIKLGGTFNGGTIEPANGFDPTFIPLFSANAYTGGLIHASGIGSFAVKGSLLGADINLGGVQTGLTLKNFTVGGQASGQLEVQGHAGAIKLGYSTIANPFTITDGPATGSFGSIGLTNPLFDSKLSVHVGSLDNFSAAGGLNMSDFVFNPIAGAVTKKFIAGGTINDTTFTAPSTYGFNLIQSRGLFGSNFDVGYIGKLSLGFGNFGGANDTDLTLRGLDNKGYSLRTGAIGEHFEHSSLNVIGSGKLGDLLTRRYFNSMITAPTIDSITATGVPNEAFGNMSVWATSNPQSGFSIKTIDIRGFATGSDIGAAGSIDKIKINCIHSFGIPFRVSAGNAMTPSGLPANLSGFASGAKINSINIDHSFRANMFDFNQGFFVAPAIGTIKIDGLINLTGAGDGGQPYGFGAASFGQIKLKDKLGGNLTLIDPPLGANNPFPSEALSHFQILKYAF